MCSGGEKQWLHSEGWVGMLQFGGSFSLQYRHSSGKTATEWANSECVFFLQVIMLWWEMANVRLKKCVHGR